MKKLKDFGWTISPEYFEAAKWGWAIPDWMIKAHLKTEARYLHYRKLQRLILGVVSTAILLVVSIGRLGDFRLWLVNEKLSLEARQVETLREEVLSKKMEIKALREEWRIEQEHQKLAPELFPIHPPQASARLRGNYAHYEYNQLLNRYNKLMAANVGIIRGSPISEQIFLKNDLLSF
jgi:hypothetical protein